MPKKWTHPLSDLIVKAEDCYDPADYVLVHKDHLAKLEAAAPLPASAALQDLIATWQWRAQASVVDPASTAPVALAILKCADELAAALSRADQP